ncbi:hypothetical protein EB118_08765 [bacterium]|nr:hypothetical protein [bacterium]NDC94669.1 hypothetical protein [bacterium]NDD84312.1 hypothetical protein [bacterium]NDG30154.1 hypothetical protein [bacterium]
MNKYEIFCELIDDIGWEREPNVGTRRPLHETVFSITAIVSTAWYLSLPVNRLDIQKAIERKKKSLKVRFYGDHTWFKENRTVLYTYAHYCEKDGDPDYSVSSENKVVSFLEHTIQSRRDKVPDVLGSTLLNWIRKCIPVLERLAEWQGYTHMARGIWNTCEIKTMKLELESTVPEEFDYARHSRLKRKRMTVQEQDLMTKVIWNNGVHGLEKVAMRSSIEAALPSADARRGMDLRQIRLGMLSASLMNRVKPMPCTVIGASLFRSKGPRNKENQVGWLRSSDRERCPIGALARYFVWMNDLSGVNFLATMKSDLLDLLRDGPTGYNPKWRSMYLIWGSSTQQPLSTSAHNQDIHRLYEAAGIDGKTAITHVFRHTKTCELLEAAVPSLSVKLFARWSDASAMESYEATSYKMDAMLAAGGWEHPSKFYCWWESPGDLCESLSESVLIGLDAVTKLAEQAQSVGGDVSAYEFCMVLKYLRKVFLEDAVVLYNKHQTFPAYRHAVLTTPHFKEYAQLEVVETNKRRSKMFESHDVALNEEIKKLFELISHTQSVQVSLSPPPEVTTPKVTTLKVSSEVVIIPEPPDTIVDMRSYYNSWRSSIRDLYDNHKRVHNGFKWSKFCKNPKLAAQRFSYIKTWLEFMDSCGNPEGVLDVMTEFAKRHSVQHSVIVKKLFNQMVKGVCVGDEYTALTTHLHKLLLDAGFVIEPKQKQDHSFKKRAVEV